MSRLRAQGATLVGYGHHVPRRVVTNSEIEKDLDLEPGWIAGRTGIQERRWAGPGEALSDIALPAAEQAIVQAETKGILRNSIGLLLLATSTPDHLLPPTAPLLAHRLGLTACGGVDLTGACAGYLYALGLAEGFVRLHNRPAIVIAANLLSRRINRSERASVVLFSDAAGATVLAPVADPDAGIHGLAYASDGSSYDSIMIPAGGSRQPFSSDLPDEATKMQLSNGPQVFQKAVLMMADTGHDALHQAGWRVSDVDHWIPHQANTRIIEATRHRLGIAGEKTAVTVDRFGNSSAASIALTISHLAAKTPLRPGKKILMTAAGAGLTGGAIAFQL